MNLYAKIIAISTCSFFIHISALQIFNTPDIYVISRDIEHDPSSNNQPALQIDADNITIDLAGHSIFQKLGNIQAGAMGILISPDVKNITIKNGVIHDLTGTGIIISQGCSNITLADCTLYNCSTAAIQILGDINQQASNILVKNCVIHTCATTPTASEVFLSQQATNVHIDNTEFVNNGLNNSIDIIKCINSTKSILNNCRIISNQSNTVSGIHLITSSDNHIRDCALVDNYSLAGSSNGIILDSNSQNNILENCLVETTISNGAATSEARGFMLLNSTACQLINCQARLTEATVSGTIAIGFKLQTCQRISMINCQASYNKNNASTGDAYGIMWNTVSLSSLLNCICESTTATGQGIGMQMTACTECEVKSSQFLNSSGSIKRGLKVIGGANNLFTQNIAMRNGTTAAEQIEGLPSLGATDYNTASGNISSISKPWTNIRAY